MRLGGPAGFVRFTATFRAGDEQANGRTFSRAQTAVRAVPGKAGGLCSYHMGGQFAEACRKGRMADAARSGAPRWQVVYLGMGQGLCGASGALPRRHAAAPRISRQCGARDCTRSPEARRAPTRKAPPNAAPRCRQHEVKGPALRQEQPARKWFRDERYTLAGRGSTPGKTCRKSRAAFLHGLRSVRHA